MFTGSYNRALDAKGRLLLPQNFLQTLSEDNENRTFWITSFYGRLTAYKAGQWEKIVEKLCSLSLPSIRLSNFISKIIGLAHELTPDGQGRIRIPQPLMRDAGISREIVIVGIMNKFEIWDQERFDGIALEDVSMELVNSGIDITL